MRHTTRGFTLIELMTALLVLGVLTAMAVPSFREMSRNNRIVAAQNDLVTAFAVARSEALRRSMAVTVCAASLDDDTCSGDPNWATGWLVFADPDADGAVANKDDVIRTWPTLVGDSVLSGSAATVSYTATGRVTTGISNFDIYTTGCKGEKLREVTVSVVGLVSSTRKNCP